MHNIRYAEYPQDVDREKVKQKWDHVVQIEDAGEGASGLYRPIRWIETTICDNREDAERFIEQNDRRDYDNLAVRFRSFSGSNDALTDLRQKESAAWNTYRKEENAIHYAKDKVKSAFVTCRKCGSKLSTEYIKSNYCALCRADLRPDSARERLAKLKAKAEAITAKKDAAEKNLARKSGTIKWLVKVEFHT